MVDGCGIVGVDAAVNLLSSSFDLFVALFFAHCLRIKGSLAIRVGVINLKHVLIKIKREFLKG